MTAIHIPSLCTLNNLWREDQRIRAYNILILQVEKLISKSHVKSDITLKRESRDLHSVLLNPAHKVILLLSTAYVADCYMHQISFQWVLP